MSTVSEIVHTCMSTQNTNAHEVLIARNIFSFCKPYFFLYIYYLLNIPCLAFISVFTNAYKLLLQFINILNLVAAFVLSHIWPLMYSLFGTQKYFSLFMPMTFFSNYIHVCLYTILMSFKYLVAVTNIFTWQPYLFLISIITYVFLIWKTYYKE